MIERLESIEEFLRDLERMLGQSSTIFLVILDLLQILKEIRHVQNDGPSEM
jgi:hypothetical protein